MRFNGKVAGVAILNMAMCIVLIGIFSDTTMSKVTSFALGGVTTNILYYVYIKAMNGKRSKSN